MDKIEIKYATYAKALPPQPVKVKKPGWGGTAEKMIDGSEPQPWHCLPFVEASTYGLELIYQFDTECHVVNEGGELRFDWDVTKEPGGVLTGGEFIAFEPKQNSRFYIFNTRIDLEPPPGYVIRTEPHPRFFTDETGTVPLSMIGHVQSEWWARKFFVVFKSPPPGGKHIFRKGEPYVQLLFVPQRVAYETTVMTPQEEAKRREVEAAIDGAKGQISENVWHNPAGVTFSDHYKILAKAFAREGAEGVAATVAAASERRADALPKDRPVAEVVAMANQKLKEQNYIAARDLYIHALGRDPDNAEALTQLGIVAATIGQPVEGLKMMARAAQLQPGVSTYHSNLGELLRVMGRFAEAEASFRNALRLAPRDAGLLSVLGLTIAQQGRAAEGLEACRAAGAMAPHVAAVHYRTGLIHAQQRQFDSARASYEAALTADPKFSPAREALAKLPASANP
jgi:Tfp pilus assembly protein PilF